jgi:mannopine transport system permease protein
MAPSSGTYPGRARVRRLQGGWVLGLFAVAVLLFLIAPTIVVIVVSLGADPFLKFPPNALSLRWYGEYFADPDWTGPTVFSIVIATLTAVVATVVGTMAALALVRGALGGRGVLIAAITAPMIVPHIILAIGLISLFTRVGLKGSLPGFVLAHTVLAAPYVVLTVSAALYRHDVRLDLAAMSLGASRFSAFREVTLPLIAPGVAAGAAFAFITSFDEPVVAFFISGVTQKTLPRKIFEDLDFTLTPTIAAAGTLMTLLSLVVVGAFEIRRLRAATVEGSAAHQPTALKEVIHGGTDVTK